MPFDKKKNILTSNNINFNVRNNLIKSYMCEMLLRTRASHGQQKKERRKNSQAFESWCYSRKPKINWREKITNERVLKRTLADRSFLGNYFSVKLLIRPIHTNYQYCSYTCFCTFLIYFIINVPEVHVCLTILIFKVLKLNSSYHHLE